MKTPNILHTLLCLLLASLIACAALFAWSLYEAHRQLAALPAALATLTTHIDNRLDAIETDADAQITQIRFQTFAELTHIETDANAQLTALRKDATSRVDDSLGKVDYALSLANTTELDANARITEALNQTATVTTAAAETLTAITATAKPIQQTAAQINAALPNFLDCEITPDGLGNSTCLYRRYADMTADFDRIATDVHGIADDARQAADKFVAPPTKWQKVKALAVTIGTILAKGLL